MTTLIKPVLAVQTATASETLPAPPSELRMLTILARVAWRRGLNAFGAGIEALWRKKPVEGQPRPATPGKSRASLLLLLYTVFMLLAGSAMMCYQLIERLARLLDGAGMDTPLMAAGVGLVLGLVSLYSLLFAVGSGVQDLGKVEWDLEWLFTFPIATRTLFCARLAQYAAGNAMLLALWISVVPALIVVYACAGHGFWALPLALAAAAYYVLLIAPLALIVEVAAQKKLAAPQRKNLQAVFVLCGSVLMLLCTLLITSSSLDTLLVAVIQAVPLAAWFNPFSLPVLLSLDGAPALGAGITMAVLAVVVPLGTMALAGRLVRGGLVDAPGVYQGQRSTKRAAFGGLLRGILGKELRLLARDRAFFTQTLLVPAIMIVFYALQNGWAQNGVLQNPRHAATLAFGLGAYFLIFSAVRVLVVEGQSLWLLYTFPRSLQSMLLQKTLLWAGFATLYALLVLIAAVFLGMPLDGEALLAGGVALAGVAIYAYIAAAIGVLASNPLEASKPRQLRVDLMYLYMLLASMFASAIYAPQVGVKIAHLVMSALLALAFWQRVQDHLPLLLEPTETPPRRVSLVHGLIAGLAFLCMQTIVLISLQSNTDLPLGAQMLIAFVAAGAVAGLGALLLLRKTPNLLTTTGILPPHDEPRSTLRQIVLPGILAGALAGGFGVIYLVAVDHIEALRALKDGLVSPSPLHDPALFALLVLAAPLFEEFIFRGLIYQGLRRSFRPLFAVLASAALFAVVHPPISMLPVFVLGLAAALSFQRSRLLVTPILTHMVYNAIVVIAPWVLQNIAAS